MDNTMKLLTAFIEASGYDVEEITKSVEMPDKSRPEVGSTFISKKVVDYKVTKKPSPLHVYYDDVQLEQLVANVIQLSECKVDERWIKYPKASFDAVVDWFGFQAERANAHRYIILGVEVSLDEKI